MASSFLRQGARLTGDVAENAGGKALDFLRRRLTGYRPSTARRTGFASDFVSKGDPRAADLAIGGNPVLGLIEGVQRGTGALAKTALATTGLAVGVPAAYNYIDRNVAGGNLPFGVTPEELLAEAGERKAEKEAAEQKRAGEKIKQLPADGFGRRGDTTVNTGGAATQESSERSASQRSGIEQFLSQYSPEALREFENLRTANQIRIDDNVASSLLARTQDNTRRQIEVNRINAWKEVEKQTIQSNAQIATALASLAYQSAIPNANVLTALSSSANAGVNAFK